MPETVNRITANFDWNLYVDLIRITKPETLENKHIIPLKIKIVFLKGSKTQQRFRRPERRFPGVICLDPTLSNSIESTSHFNEIEHQIFCLCYSGKVIYENNFLVFIIW